MSATLHATPPWRSTLLLLYGIPMRVCSITRSTCRRNFTGTSFVWRGGNEYQERLEKQRRRKESRARSKASEAGSQSEASNCTRHQELSKFYAPKTGQKEQDKYVVSLLTTHGIFRLADELRSRFFAPHKNKVSAHLTMFHALPGSKLPQFIQDMAHACTLQDPFNLFVGTIEKASGGRRLHMMVLESRDQPPDESLETKRLSKLDPIDTMPDFTHLASELRKKWFQFLSPQDRRQSKPHYSICSSATGSQSDEFLRQAIEIRERAGKDAKRGEAIGLLLWKYDKGFWRAEAAFHFRQQYDLSQSEEARRAAAEQAVSRMMEGDRGEALDKMEFDNVNTREGGDDWTKDIRLSGIEHLNIERSSSAVQS